MGAQEYSTIRVFEAVADALVGEDAPDHVMRPILEATMDAVGVPGGLSVLRYLERPVIVELFAERGVRIVDEDPAAAQEDLPG